MILLPTYLTYLTYYNPPLPSPPLLLSLLLRRLRSYAGRGKREGQYMDTYGNCEVRKKHGKLGGTSILYQCTSTEHCGTGRDGAVRYGAATPRPMRCSPMTS